MLWMKAWLEMRWRLIFALGIPLFVVLFASSNPRPPQMSALVSLLIFSAIYLAGSGIRTQAPFRATRGLHGSTYFTISLPVSRLRLLAIRAGAGFMGTAGVITVVICTLWFKYPLVRGSSTPMDLLALVITAAVCTACFHCVSVLLSTFLDDTWQIFGCTFVIFASWWVVAKLSLPNAANIFAFMGGASPLVTHRLPWPAMIISLVASVILFLAALKVVQNREY